MNPRITREIKKIYKYKILRIKITRGFCKQDHLIKWGLPLQVTPRT